MTRFVAIVQARFGSQRLPGKVLAELAGRSLVEWALRHAGEARSISDVVLATSVAPENDPVAALAAQLGYSVHRGPEEDVLERFVGAARAAHADVIVRLTADNPLVDPAFIDETLDELQGAPELEYIETTTSGTYPYGLSVEAVSARALEAAYAADQTARGREHVTVYVREHPEQFRARARRHEPSFGHLRWTVDTPEDLANVRALFERHELAKRWLPWRELAGRES